MGIQLDQRSPKFAMLLTLAATAIVYWIGLRGPFVFDDAQNLAPLNDWLQGRSTWTSVVMGNDSGPLGRPVSMASFVLNVALMGTSAHAFKLGNLLIHLFNGVLVFALFRRLADPRLPNSAAHEQGPWLPWLAASVWLLHPLLASTVLYVVQRMAMLSATFTLLTLLAYLSGRTSIASSRPKAGWLLLLLGVPSLTVLASLAKENGVLAVPLCALIELIAFAPPIGLRRPWAAKVFICAALVVPALLFVALVAFPPDLLAQGYDNQAFTLHDRLFTQTRILWDYVAAVLVPGGARLGVYHDDYTISHGLLDPPSTLWAIAGWLALLALAWRVRRPLPGVAFGLGFFLVGHAIESTLLPLMLYFEHRNYLPAVGMVWAVVSFLAWVAHRLHGYMHHPRLVLGAGSGALLGMLALSTATQARIWSSQESLLVDAFNKHPGSSLLRTELIAQAMAMQPPRVQQARTHAAFLLDSGSAETRRLGAVESVMIDCATGASPGDVQVDHMFDGVPEPISVTLMLAYENLSDGIVLTPCPGLPAERMAEGLARMLDRSRLSPNTLQIWRLHYRAANLFAAAGNLKAAVGQAKLAAAATTAQPQVLLFAADLLLDDGDTTGAGSMLEAAKAKLRPSDVLAHKLVGDLREKIDRAAVQSGKQ